MRQELLNDGTGRFLVVTATGSHYLVDLTNRTLCRRMAASAPLVDYLDAGFSQLRGDGEMLQLLMVEDCKLGFPAKFWVQVRPDDIPTLRTTSPVTRIEEVSS